MTTRLARTLLALAAGMLLLSGCGPHPATGEWQMNAEEPSIYARILIKTDGTAYLFVPGSDSYEVSCHWNSADRSIIEMDCIRYDQPSRHFTYNLQVIGKNNGVLIDNGRVIGHYQRYQN